MRKSIWIFISTAALLGLTWLIWFWLAAPQQRDTTLVTEVPVYVGKITRSTLRGYVTVYGTVEPEPANERPAASARVAPSVAGVVVAVHTAEGRRVAKGELLFQLDSRAADVEVAFAEKLLRREKKLIRAGGTSVKALQNAEQQLDAARVQQALLRVSSPLAGTVTRVNVKRGEAVDLTTVLAEVVDLDRLVVSASVPAVELASLELGQTGELLAAGNGAPIVGTLTYIGKQVDVRTGTAPLRVSAPANSGLRPGQFVTVRIVSQEHKDCLAVPVESVVKNAAGMPVVAVIQNDTAVQKRVTTGLRDRGLIEIEADGLQPGMTVVTEGAYALPEETRVRVLGNQGLQHDRPP